MTDRLDYDKRVREALEHHHRCVQDERQRFAWQLAILERDKQEELQLLCQSRARAAMPKLIRTWWGVLFA